MSTALDDYAQHIGSTGRHIPKRTIGRRLRDAKDDTGLNDTEFAALTGIKPRTWQRWFHFTDDSQVDNLRAKMILWAMVCQVPLEWLLTGDENAGPGPAGPGPDGGLPLMDSNHQPFDYHPIPIRRLSNRSHRTVTMPTRQQERRAA